MTKINRRKLITSAATAGVAAAAASSLPAPAIAQGKKEFKMVMAWPKNSPAAGTSAQRIADRIEAITEGKIKITLFGAGELVPAFDSFDAVSKGDADMYHAAEYYFQGKHKAYNFFTTVPFGLNSYETRGWIVQGGGQQMWDELSAGFNIKPFIANFTGVQMGGWFNREVNSLEDLKGLKMRLPGIGGEVMRRLGVAIINLPVGEIYPALQSGTIDAAEWVGPFQDLSFGFHKITKHYYYPGWHEPGTCVSMGINKGVWENLTPTEQVIVQTAIEAEVHVQGAENQASNIDALNKLVNELGVTTHRYNDDMMLAMGKVAEEVVEEIGNADEFSKKVYASFLDYRKKSLDWAGIGEHAYLDARKLYMASKG